MNGGGNWLISAAGVSDVRNICTNGSTKSSAIGTSSRCHH